MQSKRNRLAAGLPIFIVSLIVTATAWASIGIDVSTSKGQGSASNIVSTSAFATSAGNELLLAFISADSTASPNTTVTKVSGGALTWALVERTNVQKGTAEIWWAFAPSALSGVTVTATLSQKVDSSLTVMSFTGVNTSGTNGSGAIGAVGSGSANPGAPTATLVTKGNGSLVVGVGDDWDNSIPRTPGTGQTIVNQYPAPVGDTYWVQMQNSPILLSGTTVTMNDTAPTGDRYNMSIVEVLAAGGGGTTGSISGTISPANSGNGATVVLSHNGTVVATTTVVSGAYSFSNIANGTYTVTPSETGFTFTPASQSVTVNGNPATIPVFTATAMAYTVSGSVSGASSGNGATVVLSQNGTTVATTTVASGAYSFSNIANGTYTVTPSESGFTFTPASQSVTVNGNPATVPVFTATAVAYTVSGSVSGASSGNGATVVLSQNGTTVATTTVSSGAYSFSNIANGTYTVTPSESGFTFTPASQSVTVNGNPATVPVFTATAVAYTVSGSVSGASSGNGATVVLSQNGTTVATTTVSSGAYSFSNIANGTYTVTPSETGFTFTPASQSVTVNGNPATVPVFTATAVAYTVSGSVSGASSGNGATVVLSQNGTTVATTTVSSGAYSFSNIANGTYTVTPSETGFTFTPASQSVTVNGNPATVPVFTATAVAYTVSGSVSGASSGNGATVVLSQNGTTVATTTVSSGAYSFSNIANGTYTVTPSESGFTFTPPTQNVTVNGGPATVPVFTVAAAGPGFTISGNISPAASGGGAVVTLTQNGSSMATATADASGNYTFSNLSNGIYTATPVKTSFTFSPVNQTVTLNGSSVVVGNITATGFSGQLEYPDLSDIIPTAGISVVGTGGSALFQYTHDTYNGGPGPLVIQPAYNPASGTYQGTQYIYSLSSSGNWTLTQTVRVAGAFVFDSAHGHFHFPFTTYGLYTVGANGGPGTPVAASGKISFCINDSFIYNSSLPHAGALGNLGSCSDPTSLRGLNIGAVDEYDQTDDGQSISIAGVPNGTYWLRAIVDPDNYLAESSKANNETDVELTINGNSVQILQTVVPVLPAPPSVSLNSPADGTTVSGGVQLTASTAANSGVQFLIDGLPLGSKFLPPRILWLGIPLPQRTEAIGSQLRPLVRLE